MTLQYGFYNSVSSDRVYDAIDFGRIFDGMILDGVYAAIGDYFMVSENGTPDMNVLVGTGRAWFDHTWTFNDADVAVSVSTADALLPRIDVVYLEINEDTGTRANSVNILTGTPASTPVAPTLTNTATVHQYPLAHIYVGAGVTSITNANITNKVGTVDTPFVTCPLQYVTTNDLLTQWDAEWTEWFDDIKDQLSTEAETNLQAQIWDLAGVVSGAPPYADDMLTLSTHDHSGSHPQIPSGGLATSAVIESKIATGAVTTNKIAANNVTVDKIPNRTRIVTIPIPYNGTFSWPESGDTTLYSKFVIPMDFVSTGIVYCLGYISSGDYNKYGYFYTAWYGGAPGESRLTHSGNLGGKTQLMVTSNVLYHMVGSTSGIALTNVAAGDHIQISIQRQPAHVSDDYNDDIRCYSIYLSYTADS